MKTRLEKQHIHFVKYFNKNEMKYSLKALELVNEAHTGKRKDGSEEKSHLYEVLGLALSQYEGRMSFKELDILVATHALHDLTEDYAKQYPFKYLKTIFPKNMIKPLKKITKWSTFKKEEKHYEHYHVKAIRKELYAIIAKGNDRIHNFHSCIKPFSNKRKLEYIEETNKYIIPNLKHARRTFPEYYTPITSQIQMLKMLMEYVEYSTVK